MHSYCVRSAAKSVIASTYLHILHTPRDFRLLRILHLSAFVTASHLKFEKQLNECKSIDILMKNEQAGLYIHIPFCLSKCGYCSFYSIKSVNLIPEYIAALKKEIKFYRNVFSII